MCHSNEYLLKLIHKKKKPKRNFKEITRTEKNNSKMETIFRGDSKKKKALLPLNDIITRLYHIDMFFLSGKSLSRI